MNDYQDFDADSYYGCGCPHPSITSKQTIEMLWAYITDAYDKGASAQQIHDDLYGRLAVYVDLEDLELALWAYDDTLPQHPTCDDVRVVQGQDISIHQEVRHDR